MSNNLIDLVHNYVKENIGDFHSRRLESLKSLQLNKILGRKNPYLFKAKNITRAQDLVQSLLNAHLSSQEEGIFGVFLEGLARMVAQHSCNAVKSSAEGIDLEFERAGKRYLVTIKSGPNWGNNDQINRMRDNFAKAKKILKTNNPDIEIVAINGCCYGRDNRPYKANGDYFKYCGQRFWQFISGNDSLYQEIIKPLGYMAKKRNDEFRKKYDQILNVFTEKFLAEYCDNGLINWKKLLEYNSAVNKPSQRRINRENT